MSWDGDRAELILVPNDVELNNDRAGGYWILELNNKR